MNHTLKFRTRDLSVAQGALAGIGDILFRRHMSADLDDLTDPDIEGLALAVKAIAQHIGEIVTDFDEVLDQEASQ